MISYGDPTPISTYEEDHLIPLELGGAPSDVRNLWPERGTSPNPKDRVEGAGRRRCAPVGSAWAQPRWPFPPTGLRSGRSSASAILARRREAAFEVNTVHVRGCPEFKGEPTE